MLSDGRETQQEGEIPAFIGNIFVPPRCLWVTPSRKLLPFTCHSGASQNHACSDKSENGACILEVALLVWWRVASCRDFRRRFVPDPAGRPKRETGTA